MYEHDPDVLRWSFQFLDGDQFSDSGYCETHTQNDISFYEREYTGESNCDTDHTALENDEIIAHALQEEFSQLAVAESSGTSHESEDHLQQSLLTQEWYGSPTRNFCSGIEIIWTCTICFFIAC